MDSTRDIDLTSNEGRRVYERSLRLLFLTAAHKECPNAKVHIEHSVHYGVFARMSIPIDAYTVRRIEKRMREMVEQGVPFIREEYEYERLLDLMEKTGNDAALRLLQSPGIDNTPAPVYTCDGFSAYLFGECAATAVPLTRFSLRPYLLGLIIHLPQPSNSIRKPWVDQPQYVRTFREAAKWAKILGCRYIADLNGMVAHSNADSGNAANKLSINSFVWISEALHEKSIAEIADKIAIRKARVILIAGPSSSGKTTFTHRLSIQLRVIGKRPVIISLDNYYKNRDDVPLMPDGSRDLESLDSLRLDLLNDHLVRLLAGERVCIPNYDFVNGQTLPGTDYMLAADQPLLIEGIHGLNPQIAVNVPSELRFKIYISALTTLNFDSFNRLRTTDTRLIRRIVRDHLFRGSTIEHTLSMWDSVRRGEESWIFPFQESADISFNSALLYELSVLKKYAIPLLNQISPDSPHNAAASRIRQLLSYIECADVEADIPPTSILREFIGGCAFYIKTKTPETVD